MLDDELGAGQCRCFLGEVISLDGLLELGQELARHLLRLELALSVGNAFLELSDAIQVFAGLRSFLAGSHCGEGASCLLLRGLGLGDLGCSLVESFLGLGELSRDCLVLLGVLGGHLRALFMPLASLGEALNEFDSHPVSGFGLGVMLRRLLGSATGGLNLGLQLGETVKGFLGLLALGGLRRHDVMVVADLFVDPAQGLDDLIHFPESGGGLVEVVTDGLELLPFLEGPLAFLAGGGLVVHLVLGTDSVHETTDRAFVGFLTARLFERRRQGLGGVQPQG